ncbi:MAG TPA: hypothetical protein VK712_01355, partial [Verrucomicrobiae bacterium]|nr:hypothetical protein [Verrucomicrobiae bacterium]
MQSGINLSDRDVPAIHIDAALARYQVDHSRLDYPGTGVVRAEHPQIAQLTDNGTLLGAEEMLAA